MSIGYIRLPHTNPARLNRDDRTGLQIIGMAGDDAQTRYRLLPHRDPAQPNHAGVAGATRDDQFTEILIKRVENPAFLEGKSKDRFIAWVDRTGACPDNIVSRISQGRRGWPPYTRVHQ